MALGAIADRSGAVRAWRFRFFRLGVVGYDKEMVRRLRTGRDG